MPNPGGDRVGGGVWHAFSFGETPVRRFGQPIRLEDRGQNPGGDEVGGGVLADEMYRVASSVRRRTAKPA